MRRRSLARGNEENKPATPRRRDRARRSGRDERRRRRPHATPSPAVRAWMTRTRPCATRMRTGRARTTFETPGTPREEFFVAQLVLEPLRRQPDELGDRHEGHRVAPQGIVENEAASIRRMRSESVTHSIGTFVARPFSSRWRFVRV